MQSVHPWQVYVMHVHDCVSPSFQNSLVEQWSPFISTHHCELRNRIGFIPKSIIPWRLLVRYLKYQACYIFMQGSPRNCLHDCLSSLSRIELGPHEPLGLCLVVYLICLADTLHGESICLGLAKSVKQYNHRACQHNERTQTIATLWWAAMTATITQT